MGFYARYVFPSIMHRACRARTHMRQREKIVPLATGRVLEVGIGSGLNLAYYDARKVSKVWGLDPAPGMKRLCRASEVSPGIDVEHLEAPGEDIPLEDDCADTVVMTYTLCSIADAPRAMREIARVLKPGGQLLFCEHGAAPDGRVRLWQDRVTPIWKRLGGGCHLNRDIPGLIEQGGFRIAALRTMYLPGWRPASFNYWGAATHA